MGANKSKPGLFIQTDKPYYSPGQRVEGTLFINAPKPYPTSQIVMHVQGFEKTWWKPQDNPNTNQNLNNQGNYRRPPVVDGDKFGECKIMKASFVLNRWNNVAPLQGQHAFPFQFVIPSYVPGSFREETDEYKGIIGYEIRCELIGAKPENNVIILHELVVRELQKNKEESLFGQVFLYPTSCGCFKKGVSRVCCYFQKNQYVPGEECIAICEADNYKCRVPIKQVKVVFKKVVTLTSGFGQKQTFQKQINRASFPGIGPASQYTGEQAAKIQVPLKYRDSKMSIHPSTSGKLVQCHYYLEVTPILGGFCANNGRSFQVKLIILQEIAPPLPLEQPEGWSPQVYQRSSIMFNSNAQNQNLNAMGNRAYM